MGEPQRAQDGGCFSMGVTELGIADQCRTYVCAPKFTRDSFEVTTSMERGFFGRYVT